MIVHGEIIRFFDGRNGRRDGSDQGNRFGVDGKIVVEGIVEQGEELDNLGIDLNETPKGEFDLRSSSLVCQLRPNQRGTELTLVDVFFWLYVTLPLAFLVGRKSSSSYSSPWESYSSELFDCSSSSRSAYEVRPTEAIRPDCRTTACQLDLVSRGRD